MWPEQCCSEHQRGLAFRVHTPPDTGCPDPELLDDSKGVFFCHAIDKLALYGRQKRFRGQPKNTLYIRPHEMLGCISVFLECVRSSSCSPKKACYESSWTVICV